MNININLIKKYFSKKNKDSSKIISNPDKDWSVVVIVFCVVMVLVSVYIVTLFLRISDDSNIFIIQVEQVKIETVDRGMLKNVLDNYEQKEVLFEELKNSRPEFVDPS